MFCGRPELSTRRDASFLNDILTAAGKIDTIVSEKSEESFRADEVSQAAVLHYLTVIGEAVNRLTPALRENHPEIPWHQIAGTRHRIVHAYFDLDWQILWMAATEDVRQLRRQIADILATESLE